jgi:hypothetical protein
MRIKEKITLSFSIAIFLFVIAFPNLHWIKPVFQSSKIRLSDFDDIFGDVLVTRPNSYDVLIIGEKFIVKWEILGSFELVTISLYKGNEHVCAIASAVENDGEYEWTVGDLEEGNDYHIRIWDWIDFNGGDDSDYFRIASKTSLFYEQILFLSIIVGISVGMALLVTVFLRRRTISKNSIADR